MAVLRNQDNADVDLDHINVDPHRVNMDPDHINVDPHYVNMDPEHINVDPHHVNMDPLNWMLKWIWIMMIRTLIMFKVIRNVESRNMERKICQPAPSNHPAC